MIVYVLTVRARECSARSPVVSSFQRIIGYLRRNWIDFQIWAFGWKADHKGTLKRLLENTYDYVGLRLIKKLRESSDQFLDFERYLHDLHEYDLTQMREVFGYEVKDSDDNDITELSEYYIIIMLMLDEVNKVLKFFDLKHDVDDAYHGMYDFKSWYVENCSKLNDREEMKDKEKDILDKFKFNDTRKSRERLKYFWNKFFGPKKPHHFRTCMKKLAASKAYKSTEDRNRNTQSDQQFDKNNTAEKFECEDRETHFFTGFDDYMKLKKYEKQEDVLRIMYYDSKMKRFEKDITSRTIKARSSKSIGSSRSSAEQPPSLRRQGSNDAV
jgi:hypothetical protein